MGKAQSKRHLSTKQWDAIADEIAGCGDVTQGKRILQTQAPGMVKQLERISAHQDVLGHWGRSLNHDENAHTQIVDSLVLRVIAELTGKRLSGRVMHAGLLHTYGYLLSTIETPYGKKRDRYLQPDISNGLGFVHPNQELLGPQPQRGTLIGNLTWCAGQFALQDSARFAHWSPGTEIVAKIVQQHDFSQRSYDVICDLYVAANGRSVRGETLLIHFPPATNQQTSSSTSAWLIFSLIASRKQLITTFPVTADAVKQLCAMKPGDKWQASCLPYNAYFPGITDHALEVTRLSLTQDLLLQN